LTLMLNSSFPATIIHCYFHCFWFEGPGFIYREHTALPFLHLGETHLVRKWKCPKG
jgi:hypothetical protein